MLVLTATGSNRRFTLVIDPGHGGHDVGARGAISKEKNINLSVALQFGKYVERNMPDVRVIYTRKTDVFIPLKQRANIANRANADLFISVHTNALPAGKIARGFETYTLGMHRAKDNLDVAMRENSVISMEKGYQHTYQGFDPRSSESYIIFEFIQGKNMERSVELARNIQRKVCSGANRPDKGVHQAGFLVLRETSMPSCLIELGFITTADEERLLNDASRVDDIARGIYEGFAQYRNKYDKSISVPYRAADTESVPVAKIVSDTQGKGRAPC
jgi:spore_cwlD: N-acetylmuramoyl-L-alanine amidase CwlD